MSAFLASTVGKLLFYALIAGLATGGYFYWQHVVTSRAIIELQRNQLAEAIRVRDQTVREKNAVTAKFLALPDVRNRLCAVQGPASLCCQPQGKCEP